jgi:hypothetical protein
MRAVLGVLASLISVGAGLYLLGSESASAETTVFDALMHGIGAYCIARGVWMLSQIEWRSNAAPATVWTPETMYPPPPSKG